MNPTSLKTPLWRLQSWTDELKPWLIAQAHERWPLLGQASHFLNYDRSPFSTIPVTFLGFLVLNDFEIENSNFIHLLLTPPIHKGPFSIVNTLIIDFLDRIEHNVLFPQHSGRSPLEISSKDSKNILIPPSKYVVMIILNILSRIFREPRNFKRNRSPL